MKLSDIYSHDELIAELAITVSCGGNLLMNVGPNKDGIIDTIFEERLRSMGDWLQVNGEAIYGSKPWLFQNDTLNSQAWYTSKVTPSDGEVVYAILLSWPEDGKLELGSPRPGEDTAVTLLGWDGADLMWEGSAGPVSMAIQLPDKAEAISQGGWVLKIMKLQNGGNSIWK